MGWASGSSLAEDIWDLIKNDLKPKQRKIIASGLIDLFEDMDCDTIDECEELCRDAGRIHDYD